LFWSKIDLVWGNFDGVLERLGQDPEDLVPLTVGHMALGASMSAFGRWVSHAEENLLATCAPATRTCPGPFEHPR
jgi:hypothetical protein